MNEKPDEPRNLGMISNIALLFLKKTILKRTSRLPLLDGLRYLLLARRVHGIMMPVLAVLAVAFVFIAICALIPHFAVLVHMDDPTNEGISSVSGFVVCVLLAFFCVVGIPVLFATRKILTIYWLLIFMIHFIHIPRAPNEI